MTPGLKLSNFGKPSQQAIFHENYDSHYLKQTSYYPPKQPTLSSVFADLHAKTWKVTFRQNTPQKLYDPNWFSYGPDATGNIILNTDTPNVGADVRTGFDF
ncbi:MAG: hypothetical protein M3Y82_12670 [Verrucomicrobiota bacterium]|nr:hypothetical protein [Verrucomicrobiota bacterium]